MLRTGFLNYRRSYMTTLRTRWEKPDYTGVIAEVPLGHDPSPKNLSITRILTFIFFPGSPGFWTVYSPVTGTIQIGELASFFEGLFTDTERSAKCVCFLSSGVS